jgi:O-antigen/teichoic acid export membrane protein
LSRNRAIGVYLSLAFLQRSFGLLLLPFLTRVLSTETYALVSVVVVVGTLWSLVLGSAFESAVFRWAARVTTESTGILRVSAIYLYWVLPLAGFASAIVLWFLRDSTFLRVPNSIWALEILAMSLMPASSYFALSVARARDDVVKYVSLALPAILLLAGSKVIFVLTMNLGLFGWVLSDLVAYGSMYFIALLSTKVPKRGVTAGASQKLIRFSLPLLPQRFAFWSLTSMGRPLLIFLLPLSAVGLYSMAFNLALVASIVLGEINRAVLVSYSKESFPAPTLETLGVGTWQMLLAFVVPAVSMAGIAIGAPLLVGDAYHAGLPLIPYLMVGIVAYGLYLVPMNYLVQTGGVTVWSWTATTVAAIVTLVGILIFTPLWGLHGASFAQTLGYLAMMLSAFGLTRWSRLAITYQLLIPRVLALNFALVGFLMAAVALIFYNTGFRLLLGVIGFIFAALAVHLQRCHRTAGES